MLTGSIVLRNFRCFDWENPGRLDLCEGFVAILGPNNCGKSTLLKAIYELREVFDAATSCLYAQTGYSFPPTFLNVRDPLELCFNHDERGFEIEINCDGRPQSELSDQFQVIQLKLRYSATDGRIRPVTLKGVSSTGVKAEIATDVIVKNTTGKGSATLLHGGSSVVFNIVVMQEFCSLLATKCVYFPAFRNAINSGGTKYYDISIGTELIRDWDFWSTGGTIRQQRAASKVQNDICQLLGFKSLQIQTDPGKTMLQVKINDRPFQLVEVGAGVAQLIITLASVLIKAPAYLLIDEPELNLHPALQMRFLKALASLVSTGVVYATHSVGLARGTTPTIYCITKQVEGAAKMAPFAARGKQFSQWLGELSYSTRLELGADKLLLVEGPTDVLFFHELLRKLGKDTEYVVLSLGGASEINGNCRVQLEELIRVFDASNVMVFVDSERSSADAVDRSRIEFIRICNEIGFTARLSEKRATDNYITQAALDKLYPGQYSALGPYESLKEHQVRWSKSVNWRFAAEMSIEEFRQTDLGEFLEIL